MPRLTEVKLYAIEVDQNYHRLREVEILRYAADNPPGRALVRRVRGKHKGKIYWMFLDYLRDWAIR